MKKDFYFLSKDNVTQIHGIEWIPEGKVTAVLQLCHGMVEYMDRYHEFAVFMAEHGVYVVGHDHLGHGQSVTSSEKLGYFSGNEGNWCVISDIHQVRLMTEKKYPNVPYFMLGHSMGSFLVRQYLGEYSKGISGAIIMGTGNQPDVVLAAGKLLCKWIGMTKGWNHRSKFINQMAVGGYEKKFGLGWLSKNPQNIEAYKNDPLCGFIFTVNAYYNMFSGMQRMNQQEKKNQMEEKIPLFFVAGEEDPVGNCGKAVKDVVKLYKKNGYQDVEMKLYPGDRHEILNELDREVVYQDILMWLENRK